MEDSSDAKFSKKLTELARSPKYRGAIFQIEADEKGLALVDGKESSLKIYLMIDPESDQILETRFFTYGGPVFTALADLLCEKLQKQHVDTLVQIKTEDLEKELRDDPATPAFPENAPEKASFAALLLKLHDAYHEKKIVALATRETMERIKYRTQSAEGRAEADKEWDALTDDERLAKIGECLHINVRSTLQNDGGDLEVLGIKDKTRVQVRFQGACAGCGSAMGGTLFYIEDELQNKVYYDLTVEPEDPLANYPGGVPLEGVDPAPQAPVQQ